ncbi:MAG: thioredoxin [Thermoplasmata archaeon]|nr:thioredoxin [Thermoplasmata archaeon]
MDEIQKIRARILQRLMETKDEQKLPARPIHVSEQEFNEMISKYDTVVVDFWAPWCQPCKIIEPMVERLAKKYKGKVVFLKVNVDRNKKIAMKYRVMSIPTIGLFKNGRLVDRQIGAIPYDIFDSWVGRFA